MHILYVVPEMPHTHMQYSDVCGIVGGLGVCSPRENLGF